MSEWTAQPSKTCVSGVIRDFNRETDGKIIIDNLKATGIIKDGFYMELINNG